MTIVVHDFFCPLPVSPCPLLLPVHFMYFGKEYKAVRVSDSISFKYKNMYFSTLKVR